MLPQHIDLEDEPYSIRQNVCYRLAEISHIRRILRPSQLGERASSMTGAKDAETIWLHPALWKEPQSFAV